MMNDIDEIKYRLLDFCNIFTFKFDGHNCGVDPFNEESFHLCRDGIVLEVHSIDEVFDTPYFGGKALKDIIDEIEIIEW